MTQENKHTPTDDFVEDDEATGRPDYYECLSCGYSCVKRPSMGGQCPKCIAIMEEGYY